MAAGIDLALAMVEEDLGREVALAIARGLVVFLRRQHVYVHASAGSKPRLYGYKRCGE
jgi:transcriptional regulator GlxA family with amidase domain